MNSQNETAIETVKISLNVESQVDYWSLSPVMFIFSDVASQD